MLQKPDHLITHRLNHHYPSTLGTISGVAIWLWVHFIYAWSIYHKKKKKRKSKKCCNYPKIWTVLCYYTVMHPKDADRMANRVDLDQIAPLEQLDLGLHCLFWVLWIITSSRSVGYLLLFWHGGPKLEPMLEKISTTLSAVFSQTGFCKHCIPKGAVWSLCTLFAIRTHCFMVVFGSDVFTSRSFSAWNEYGVIKGCVHTMGAFHACQRITTGPGHAKMCLMPYGTNKGADQPAHPRSLISTFVVRCLDSIMPLVFISEISRL